MVLAYMLLGVALLGVVLLLARWFSSADPKSLVRVVKWVGGTLAALFVLSLVVSGRAGLALTLGIPALILLRRALRGGGFAFPGRARPSPGQGSTVETAYLRMHLDHDSGEMDGTVLKGAFAGRDLSALALGELLALFSECLRSDSQSARVLESYLDRGEHRDWRERMDARERTAGASAAGGMTPDEARDILGVGPDATGEEIKEAHRHLMQINHPDHGGSTYLAAKINRAKEILLGS